jgi:FkbM family methyltransferase
MAGSIGVQLIEKDDTICSWLAAGNAFETDSLARWAEICAAGGMVLDIGAYTGLFSVVAAKQGCDVIAFEPMPMHFKRCRENFALNDVHVDVRNACVSDTVGEAVIKYNPNVRGLTSGASLLYPSGGRKGEELPHKVKSATIDSLGLKQCTAIKIDVERAEPLVLAGATETLARCRPALLVEVLGEDEKRAVRAAVPGYRVVAEFDERNWIMEAR